MENRKLRVGIIGTGGIAHSHMHQYVKFDDVEVVAGVDLVPGKAKAFFEEFGITDIKCDYKDHKEMLDDESLQLDAVSICTYNRQHMPCTVYALKKGVNVLLEKPMCVELEEGIEIMKAEKESGKIVSIGFQPRFDPSMQLVKKIIQSGVLGKIYYIQTGGGRRRGIPASSVKTTFIEDATGGIGALGDIGCYSLDMLLNALGYPKPLTITGYTSNYFGTNPKTYESRGCPEVAKKFEVDDFGAAFIRMEDDLIIDFRISWAINIDTPGDTLVLGTEGGLRIPSTNCWNGRIDGALKIYHEMAGEQTVTEIPIPQSDVNCVELKVRSFLDAVRNGGEAPVPTSQIIINQAILSGIKKSAELKEEIKVEIPEI